MAGFDPSRCTDRTYYCGNGDIPVDLPGTRKLYHQHAKGTPAQCVRIGFGAGKYTEQRSSFPANSLRRIPYVSATVEQNFQNTDPGINNLTDLYDFVAQSSRLAITAFLTACCTSNAGVFNRKSYNAILLFLFDAGYGFRFGDFRFRFGDFRFGDFLRL